MEEREREKLLLARADELQREYENLVRSLDSAFDTIKAINRALTENRLESRKIFEERLVLASPTNLTSQIDQVRTEKRLNFRRSDVENNNEAFDQILRKLLNQFVGDNPKLDEFVASANQKLSQYIVRHSAVDNNDPSSEKNRSSDAKRHYVGDEHSYAVNEDTGGEEQDIENEISNRQLITVREVPSCAATNDITAKKRTDWREVWLKKIQATDKQTKEKRNDDEIDLSIVKTEWPDESNEASIFSDVHEPNVIVFPMTKKALSTIKENNIERRRIVSRFRRTKEMVESELLERKRKQTRERMRRWRAKKRLQEALTNVKAKNTP